MRNYDITLGEKYSEKKRVNTWGSFFGKLIGSLSLLKLTRNKNIEYYYEVTIGDLFSQKVSLKTNLLKNLHTVFHSGYINLQSHQQCKRVFSTPSPVLVVRWFFFFFNDGHSDRCQVISLCSFDLHVSNNEWCWASLHVFTSYPYVFFREMSV